MLLYEINKKKRSFNFYEWISKIAKIYYSSLTEIKVKEIIDFEMTDIIEKMNLNEGIACIIFLLNQIQINLDM